MVANMTESYLPSLTACYLRALGRDAGDGREFTTMLATLELAHDLGQLVLLDGGFYAYLRCRMQHIDRFYARDLAAVKALGRQELISGPVVFVAEVLATKPGVIGRAMLNLRRLPGVEYLAAWRNQVRWKVRRVLREADRDGRLV